MPERSTTARMGFSCPSSRSQTERGARRVTSICCWNFTNDDQSRILPDNFDGHGLVVVALFVRVGSGDSRDPDRDGE